MSQRDYYDILGIPRDAEPKDIKRAYRKLAMKFHPDRNPNDAKAEAKFREAAEAYETLSDPEQRTLYDQFGHAGLSGGGRRGGRDFSDIDDIFSEFGDIFGDVFGGFAGGGAPRGGPRPGADLRYDLELSFDEAVFGTTKTVKIPRHTTCETCEGSGAKPGTEPARCAACGGSGQIRHTQGFFTLSSTCPECGGTGEFIEDPCVDCQGRGVLERTRDIEVTVPAGVEAGNRLRLRGEGEEGQKGGPRGDLYVVLHVAPSEIFERDGADLHYEAEISFVQAALGCTIEVPTLEATQKLVIDAGTQPGDTRVLRGAGVQRLQSNERGDLYVHLAVTVPTELDADQRELLEQFAAVSAIPTAADDRRDDGEAEDAGDDDRGAGRSAISERAAHDLLREVMADTVSDAGSAAE